MYNYTELCINIQGIVAVSVAVSVFLLQLDPRNCNNLRELVLVSSISLNRID